MVLFPELAPLLENLNNNCDYYFQEGQRLEQQRLSAAAPVAPAPAAAGSTDNVTNKAGGGGGGDERGLAEAEEKVARADLEGLPRALR